VRDDSRIPGEAKNWIDRLGLLPHPEGGFYRESYRCPHVLKESCLPAGYRGDRSLATVIYYLLYGEHFSVWHRLCADEIWFHHAGASMILYGLTPGGELSRQRLGGSPELGESLQILIPAGQWFAAKVALKKSYSLVGCMVTPGFDFADFEHARRAELLRLYPRQRQVIEAMTHEEENP
jgi:predicted cupin superfamily sugar epimerase